MNLASHRRPAATSPASHSRPCIHSVPFERSVVPGSPRQRCVEARDALAGTATVQLEAPAQPVLSPIPTTAPPAQVVGYPVVELNPDNHAAALAADEMVLIDYYTDYCGWVQEGGPFYPPSFLPELQAENEAPEAVLP